MKLAYSATYPKDDSAPETNEDYLVCDRLKDVYCMSDGASESYDSKNWARVLVEKYIKSSRVTRSWVLKAIETYRASVNQSELSWSQQAAFERGSFATLLGVQLHDRGRCIRVTSIGDSLCVLCDGDRFARSFRYNRPNEFAARPQLLASDIRLNQTTLSSLTAKRLERTWSTGVPDPPDPAAHDGRIGGMGVEGPRPSLPEAAWPSSQVSIRQIRSF